MEILDKLIVEQNYLPEQIFNIDETFLFWKGAAERISIHKEAKSMSGCKVCVSPLYDVRTMTKLPNGSHLRTYLRRSATPACMSNNLYLIFSSVMPRMKFVLYRVTQKTGTFEKPNKN